MTDKKKLDPASRKVLDDAMAAFTRGVEEHRANADAGKIKTLHDVMPVDPAKADDHLKE